MPEANLQEEAELIAGFLARRPAAEVAFIERLRSYLRREIRHNFPKLWHSSEDLQQDALLKLCKVRADPGEVERIRPPLAELARYLINAPARVMIRSMTRLGTRVELREWDGSHAQGQEDSTYLKQLWRLLPRLPFKYARTLQMHAAHVTGDGPALHEALGITQDAAKRKLLDAQDALLTLSRSEADHE